MTGTALTTIRQGGRDYFCTMTSTAMFTRGQRYAIYANETTVDNDFGTPWPVAEILACGYAWFSPRPSSPICGALAGLRRVMGARQC